MYNFIYILAKQVSSRNPQKFRFISDELYIKIKYYSHFKKKLNLNNPRTFNEKLQWLKINDRNDFYIKCVDKYLVRKVVEEKIGRKYLIPLIDVWNKFDEIDISKLPNKFVLKTTHDSGSILICDNKNEFNFNYAKQVLSNSLKRNYFYSGREWPYKNVRPRIICEEYMIDESGLELKDYKFMCFNGKPKIIQVMSERKNGHYFINHFDLDWNELDIPRKSIKRNVRIPRKPKNLKEMIRLSEILSKDMPFARIDLYETEVGIYFGEITFFPVSGFMDFEKEKDNELLGSWIKLKNIRNK